MYLYQLANQVPRPQHRLQDNNLKLTTILCFQDVPVVSNNQLVMVKEAKKPPCLIVPSNSVLEWNKECSKLIQGSCQMCWSRYIHCNIVLLDNTRQETRISVYRFPLASQCTQTKLLRLHSTRSVSYTHLTLPTN